MLIYKYEDIFCACAITWLIDIINDIVYIFIAFLFRVFGRKRQVDEVFLIVHILLLILISKRP